MLQFQRESKRGMAMGHTNAKFSAKFPILYGQNWIQMLNIWFWLNWIQCLHFGAQQILERIFYMLNFIFFAILKTYLDILFVIRQQGCLMVKAK